MTTILTTISNLLLVLMISISHGRLRVYIVPLTINSSIPFIPNPHWLKVEKVMLALMYRCLLSRLLNSRNTIVVTMQKTSKAQWWTWLCRPNVRLRYPFSMKTWIRLHQRMTWIMLLKISRLKIWEALILSKST